MTEPGKLTSGWTTRIFRVNVSFLEKVFFGEQVASHFLFAVVVDGILMSGQVVAAAEDWVARFAN